jgi:hypothetical protein
VEHSPRLAFEPGLELAWCKVGEMFVSSNHLNTSRQPSALGYASIFGNEKDGIVSLYGCSPFSSPIPLPLYFSSLDFFFYPTENN